MSTHNPNDSLVPGLRFLSKRLFSFAGYLSPPTVYDAMMFYLPPFSSITTRVVRVQNLMLELWSPNSSLHAYYPGLSDTEIGLGTELENSMRRSDGHLGRFDYTIGPQHYDEQRPWLGFIKRRRYDASPENSSFLDVWSTTSLPNYGVFRPTFVNLVSLLYTRLLKKAVDLEAPLINDPDVIHRRPTHLLPDKSNLLRGIMTLDDAVDLLASIQRDLKELDAWNRMTENYRLNYDDHNSITTVPVADDSMIGVWLNGVNESTGLWLLQNRIPCYIIHESNGSPDWQRLNSNPYQCVMMNARTDHFEFEKRVKIFERELLKNGQALESLVSDIGILPYSRGIRSMQCDRVRSSSFGQGWVINQYVDPRTNKTFESADPPLLEREGKIIPPAVQNVGEGKWTHWVEEGEIDEPRHLRLRSKAYKGERGEYEYYDRVKRRHIYVDDPLEIPRHYDANVKIFGVPGPDLPFLIIDVHGNRSEQAKSFWVYEKERPLPGEIGREYVVEEVEEPPPPTLEEHADSPVSSGAEDDYPMFPNYPPDDVPVDESLLGGSSTTAPTEANENAVLEKPSNSGNQGIKRDRSYSPEESRRRPYSRSPDRGYAKERRDKREPRPRTPRFEEKTYKYRRRTRSPPRLPMTQRYSPVYRRRSPPSNLHSFSARRSSPSPSGNRFSNRNYKGRNRNRSPSPRRRSRSRQRSPYPPYYSRSRQRSRSRYRSHSRHRSRSRRRSPVRWRSPSPRRSFSRQRKPSRPRSPPLQRPQSCQGSPSNRRTPSPHRPDLRSRSPLLRRLTSPAPGQSSVLPSLSSSSMGNAVWDVSLISPNNLQVPTAENSNSERAVMVGNFSQQALIRPQDVPAHVLAMFPAPEIAPVAIQKRIFGGISRFLIVWNLPVIMCWNNVLELFLRIVAECVKSKVRLLQVYRTNEMGHQIFWLKFKQPEHAESFRGRATYRETDEDVLIKCDFVTDDEFSAVAGNCIDKWCSSSGLLAGSDPLTLFPEDSRGYLSVPSLAARLGISSLALVPRPPKKRRGARGGVNRDVM